MEGRDKPVDESWTEIYGKNFYNTEGGSSMKHVSPLLPKGQSCALGSEPGIVVLELWSSVHAQENSDLWGVGAALVEGESWHFSYQTSHVNGLFDIFISKGNAFSFFSSSSVKFKNQNVNSGTVLSYIFKSKCLFFSYMYFNGLWIGTH